MAVKFKAGVLLFLAFFLASCTTNVAVKKKSVSISVTLKKMFYLPESAPEQFEKSFPSSGLILSGITYFKKVYPSVVIATNVKDFSFDKYLVFLKGKALYISKNYCSKISLKDEFSRVYEQDMFVIAENKSKASLFNTELCGRIKSFKFKGDLYFHYPYLCFIYGKKFTVERIGSSGVFLSGGLTSLILTAGFYKNYLLLFDSIGRLVFIDLKDKRFKGVFRLKRLKNPKINHCFLYGFSNNRFLSYRIGPNKVKPAFNRVISFPCVTAGNYPAVLCKGVLYFDNKTIVLGKMFDKFFIKKPFLIGEKNGEVLLVDVAKKRFLKGFILKKPSFLACIDNGSLYFNDLDGKIKKLDNKTLRLVKSFPDNCTVKLLFKDGNFERDGKIFYHFAKLIASKNGFEMLKRRIGNTIYYFFEQIKQ